MSNKKNMLITHFLLIIIIVMPGISFAMPAAPKTHLLSQPDGTVINARLWGDKWSHGWETVEGHSIVFEKNARKWHYATHNSQGKLTASAKIVGKDPGFRKMKKHLRPKGPAREQSQSIESSSSASIPEGAPPLTGTANIPVILINFSNTSTSYTTVNFDSLLFGTGSKSMKDYYEEVSYGAFTILAGPSGVAGWYTAAQNHDYYGQNDGIGQDDWPGTLVREAVAAADPTFNFAPYDQDGDCYVDIINLVHQGSGEEAGGSSTDIWSHRWNLASAFYFGYSDGGVYTTDDDCPQGGKIMIDDYVIQPEILWGNMQTVGVFAHEYGHALGLIDLYDTDYTSNGIGDWGLMASGSWNYVTRSGDTPAHMSAWSKVALGWVTPLEVVGTLTDEPIDQAATAPDIYKFTTSNPPEYFLVENRQLTGFDAGLPGAGLAIWHIDNYKSGNKQECYPPFDCSSIHYKVALVQADGLWHLEKDNNQGNATDLWYLGNVATFNGDSNPDSDLYDGTPSNISVTNISSPGSTMTATLSVQTVAPGPPVPGTVTPSNNQFNTFVDNPFDLTTNFTDNNSGITSCEYCRSIDGTCDSEWTLASLSGSGPTWTCSQTGITGNDAEVLTLNMRATSAGGTGEGSAIARTVDSALPTTSDNSSSAWTSASPVSVTLSPDDGSGSGIASTLYCVDTAGSCTPGTAGTSANVTCGNNQECMKYVRYFSDDNVGNQETVKTSNVIRQDRKIPKDGTASAIPDSSRIDLSWSGFSDTGSGLDPTDPYKLVYATTNTLTFHCANGTEITSVTTEASYIHTGLTNGQRYFYRICAIDAAGNLSPGLKVNATPQLIEYQLTTDINPLSSGSITPDCTAGCIYESGMLVILTASETSGYPFIDWTGCDSASNNICTMTMDDDKNLTAVFDATCLLAARNLRTSVYYSTLQDAYDAAEDGDTIQSRITVFNNNVYADRDISVVFDGGYNCTYSDITGTTTLNGNMTIDSGTVTIGDYVLGN